MNTDKIKQYFEYANKKGYVVLTDDENKTDFVLMPMVLLSELAKLDGVNDVILNYYKTK